MICRDFFDASFTERNCYPVCQSSAFRKLPPHHAHLMNIELDRPHPVSPTTGCYHFRRSMHTMFMVRAVHLADRQRRPSSAASRAVPVRRRPPSTLRSRSGPLSNLRSVGARHGLLLIGSADPDFSRARCAVGGACQSSAGGFRSATRDPISSPGIRQSVKNDVVADDGKTHHRKMKFSSRQSLGGALVLPTSWLGSFFLLAARLKFHRSVLRVTSPGAGRQLHAVTLNNQLDEVMP